MKFSKLMEEMRTIRDYKKAPVEKALIQEVLDVGRTARGIAENASVLFIENGKELFDKLSGKAGYFGKMMEAPHYLAVVTKEGPGYLENSGYIMELMRMKAWELGLGTCWLSIQDESELKKILGVANTERLTAFAAIGYPYKGIFKKDISPKSSRLSMEEIVYLNQWNNSCTVEQLEQLGFANIIYFAKYAPSYGNRQPWKLIVDHDKIFLTVAEDGKPDTGLDAGIMMLYFEKASREEGISGVWKIDVTSDLYQKYAVPSNYRVVGYYQI